jgi:hypothetical protein
MGVEGAADSPPGSSQRIVAELGTDARLTDVSAHTLPLTAATRWLANPQCCIGCNVGRNSAAFHPGATGCHQHQGVHRDPGTGEHKPSGDDGPATCAYSQGAVAAGGRGHGRDGPVQPAGSHVRAAATSAETPVVIVGWRTGA